MSKVNTDMLEVNKPSVLTQIVFTKEVDNGYKLFEMTGLQVDLANVVLWQLWKQINKKEIVIDKKGSSTFMEIDMSAVSEMIGKYKKNQYKEWLKQFKLLSNIEIVINTLNKKKDEEEMAVTRFIQEIVYTKNTRTNKRTIKVAVSNRIADKYLSNTNFFSKMFLKIQFSMHSKYSKLLYELMKDYEGISKIIHIDVLYELLNVTKGKQRIWSIFRPNILEKAIKEINALSDISVKYEIIKEKPEGGRLQVTKVKFIPIEQDEKRLIELGVKGGQSLSMDEQLIINKKKSIALIRLEKAKKYQTINNEEAWLKKTIESITDEYLEEQDLNEDAKQRLDEIDIKEYGDRLMQKYNDVVGIKDYKLFYVFEDKFITNSALETYRVLEEIDGA